MDVEVKTSAQPSFTMSDGGHNDGASPVRVRGGDFLAVMPRKATRSRALFIAALLVVLPTGCVTREADRDATIHNDTGIDLVLVLHNSRRGEDVVSKRLPARGTVPIGLGSCRVGWRVTTLEGTLVKRLGRICADDDDLKVAAADLPDPPS